VSHGVGLLAALVATPFLILAAARRGGVVAIVGASVFAGTVIALYLASTLYHALPRNKAKRVFRVIDHSAIFLLIAGTYTTALYIGMGWLALIAIRPLWLHVPMAGWMWLIAGGLAYTAGIAFYAAERLRYGHLVWHVFVLMGTTCHFFAVLWYAA
jgi:hemolysin III